MWVLTSATGQGTVPSCHETGGMAGGNSRMIRPCSLGTHALLPNVGEVGELIECVNRCKTLRLMEDILWGNGIDPIAIPNFNDKIRRTSGESPMPYYQQPPASTKRMADVPAGHCLNRPKWHIEYSMNFDASDVGSLVIGPSVPDLGATG